MKVLLFYLNLNKKQLKFSIAETYGHQFLHHNAPSILTSEYWFRLFKIDDFGMKDVKAEMFEVTKLKQLLNEDSCQTSKILGLTQQAISLHLECNGKLLKGTILGAI